MAEEPNQSEITQYFKAMAEGKLQDQDVYSIGKPVGGRHSRVIHYRMSYPNGPVNTPVQNVTSEIAQTVDQAKAEAVAEGRGSGSGGVGIIKHGHHHKKHKSSSSSSRDNIKKKTHSAGKKSKRKHSKKK